jgi:hypothetical protein
LMSLFLLVGDDDFDFRLSGIFYRFSSLLFIAKILASTSLMWSAS